MLCQAQVFSGTATRGGGLRGANQEKLAETQECVCWKQSGEQSGDNVLCRETRTVGLGARLVRTPHAR